MQLERNSSFCLAFFSAPSLKKWSKATLWHSKLLENQTRNPIKMGSFQDNITLEYISGICTSKQCMSWPTRSAFGVERSPLIQVKKTHPSLNFSSSLYPNIIKFTEWTCKSRHFPKDQLEYNIWLQIVRGCPGIRSSNTDVVPTKGKQRISCSPSLI